MIIFLSVLALAQDIHEVPKDTAVEVVGPAVWMTPAKFRQYVTDSRNLETCQAAFNKAVDEALDANERALRAVSICDGQMDSNEALVAEQVQTIATQAARLDELAERANRLKQQRNVAWGIAGGFLAASTAAVVLSLD